MKKEIFIWVFLIGSFFYSFSQMNIRVIDLSEVLKKQPVDKTQFTVQYEMSWVSDREQPEKKITETMVLKVGEKSSQFYSYANFLTDSILEADKAAAASQEVMIEHIQQYNGQVNYEIYKNYPAGKVTTLDQVSVSKLRCEEKNETPVWQLQEDTLTFLSYACRKATCHFKGRDYEVWYTDEIPRSEGPWKLHGLPGLILKARDANDEYSFVCTGVEKMRREDFIMYGDTNYEPVSRKDYNKINERFMSDPIGFIKQMAPHVNVIVKNESGDAITPKNIPYNPIEL